MAYALLCKVKTQKHREEIRIVETQFSDEPVLRRLIGGAPNSLYHDSMSWGAGVCHHFVTI
jgi:hypothetical protein